MKFYNEVREDLKNYVNHYWIAQGDMHNETLKIIPIDHIDMLLTIEGQYYVKKNEVFELKREAFFTAMMDSPTMVRSNGHLVLFGVSFKPWGFYPIVGDDLDKYKNRSVDLKIVNPKLDKRIKEARNKHRDKFSEDIPDNFITLLEDALVESISESSIDEDLMEILYSFCQVGEGVFDLVKSELNLSNKYVERLFKKYVGIPPAKFFKIKRFHDATRKVIGKSDVKLTDIAYDSDYYDQAHFIRDFKKYVEETPSGVRKKKTILKSRYKYIKDD
ncbi:MAG: helix-turn-helix domain-containing protein [Firmicutes bacterium]|jgi:AraC-like DNA-binding protein|nr:helix-turn-helix domain-containing protein [Bacillota bacterium]